MDTAFFMYYEEADLCRRIIDEGWEIHYLADARITHFGGVSAKQAKRYLTSVAWRFNRRYQLDTLTERLAFACIHTQPHPYRTIIAG